jgi:hypothetical protein
MATKEDLILERVGEVKEDVKLLFHKLDELPCKHVAIKVARLEERSKAKDLRVVTLWGFVTGAILWIAKLEFLK